jgi:hypothetical protein
MRKNWPNRITAEINTEITHRVAEVRKGEGEDYDIAP